MSRISKYITITIFVLFCTSAAFAQKDKAKVLAAYINKFAQYTEWINEKKLDSFRIIIYTENLDIINEFKDYAKSFKIKDKPVSVSFLNTFNIPQNTHIIFVSEEKSNLLMDIYDRIDKKNILLISEEYKDKRSIMINLYRNAANQILFDVNKANIIGQNLTLDPEVLLMGGTEVDVANLYRKSQIDLREFQKNMTALQDSFRLISGKIAETNKQIQQKEREINQLEAKAEEQLRMLLAQGEKADSLHKELETQKQTMTERQLILNAQKDSIDKKTAEYNRQLEDIKSKKLEMERLEASLIDYRNKIKSLNSEINRKNITLDSQSETIKQQESILFLIIVSSFLLVLLVITVYVSFRKNQKKNKKLLKQKMEIEEKLLELERLNDKLQKADQYKSIFLASMSHELRTPLNSIIGYTGIMLMGMTGALSEEQTKQLSKVKSNAKHLLSLINDILDISKIEAERVELNVESFKVSEIISQAMETVQPKASEKGLMLSKLISEDFDIFTDKRRLMQVVFNLVSNAVNYTEKGNVHIVSELLADENLKISVRDTGIGISEEEMTRLFQPFHQIDSSLTKKNSGTGLGLYLSRKIMTMLQGDIFVKSDAGKGSDFYIIMPVKLSKEKK